MDDKFPKIYKNKVDKIKSKVQKDFYYHAGNTNDNEQRTEKSEPVIDEKVDRMTLLKKINSIFTRPDYVYQADVIIMYKNGENKQKKIVGIKDNYLITIDNERILIDEVSDIK